MQKVEIYTDMYEAKRDMEKHIESGWRIYTCAMGSYMCNLANLQDVLVVYEKVTDN